MAGDLKTQIEVGVDGSGVTAGVENIKKSLDTLGQKAVQVGKQAADGIDGIGTGAAPTAAKVDAATKNMIGSIQRQIAVMEAGSKSGADYYRVLAGQRGIDTNALKPYLDQLDAITVKQKAAQAALQGTAPALNQVGISAAQTAAALRGVPAQFTDIVTSLQGGQAPLTVFLQQGGQLKDMFGGVGAAASALSGYVASLINPITLGAAALGIIAVAAYQGSQEMTAYSKALILTGGASGKTAGDLQVLARQISATAGTQSQAAEALIAAVGSGKIAVNSLESVGTAAVSMSRTLGISIDDAVGQFAKLADEPAKASAKLNEQYHYLSASTYQRIRDLEEQGQKEAAAALAQNTYASASIARMKQVGEQAGILSKTLSGLGDVASGMWKTIAGAISSVGAQQTSAQRVIEAQRKVSYLETNGSSPKAMAEARGELDAAGENDRLARRSALMQAERQRGEEEKMAANQRLTDQKKATRSRADQRREEIEQLDRDAKVVGLSKEEYDRRASAINDKYKDPKGAKPKSFQDDAGTRYIQQLREQEAALQARLEVGEKLTGAAKELAEFEQKISDLKGKKQLTNEQKDLLARQDEIRAILQQMGLLQKLGQIEDDEAKKKAKRAQDEVTFQDRAAQLQEQIATAQAGRREASDRTLGGFGKSDSERQRIEAVNALYRESERYQAQLAKATPKDLLGSDGYIQAMLGIKSALDISLEDHNTYYKRLKEMQSDGALGFKSAIASYVDESANAYRQMEQAGGNALRGVEDYFVSMATTGKASFKGLVNSVIADMARMQARIAVSGLAKLLGNALTNLSYSGSSTNSSAANYENQMDRGVSWNAKGNVFASPSLSTYSNGIYNRPQYFEFAKGAGIFAEAGPEAIMPLSRGPDGKLGVAATSGGGGNVVVHNYAGVQVETGQERNADGGIDQVVIIRQVEKALAQNIAAGSGAIHQAMKNRYGVSTSTR